MPPSGESYIATRSKRKVRSSISQSSQKTYLPHGHKVVPEEVNVDLSWHLGRLLHVHIVVEEVLEGRDLT